VVLALAKNVYGPFVLLLFLVPTSRFRSRRAHVTYVAGVFGAALAGALVWASQVARIHYTLPGTAIDSVDQAEWARGPPSASWWPWPGGSRPRSSAGRCSLRSWRVKGGLRPSKTHSVVGDLAPWPLIVVALALLVLGLFAADPPLRSVTGRGRGRRWSRSAATTAAVVVAIASACTVLIGFGLALTSAPVAPERIEWLQGRYFLPLFALVARAAPALTPAAAGQPDSAPGSGDRPPPVVPGVVVAASAFRWHGWWCGCSCCSTEPHGAAAVGAPRQRERPARRKSRN